MSQIGSESVAYQTYHELDKYARRSHVNMSCLFSTQTKISIKNKTNNVLSAGEPIGILHKTINATCLATTAFFTIRSIFYDTLPHKIPGKANPLRDEIMRSPLQRFFTSPTISFALMSFPLINYLSPLPFIGFAIPIMAQKISFLARSYSKVRSMLGFYEFVNTIIKRRQERVKNPQFGINLKRL